MTAVLHAVPDESTSPEAERLAALEGVIDRGIATFIEVGLALAEIKELQLFRVTHPSFKAYVEDRWSFGYQSAYQRIYGAHVAQAIMAAHGPLPAGISVEALRPLQPLLNQRGPKAVAEAWGIVLERYGRRWRSPTRDEVRVVLVEAGLPTCSTGRKSEKVPEIVTIGDSLDRALARVARVREVLNGRPMPLVSRRRAGEFARKAHQLAAELDSLADPRAARTQLEAREAGVAPGDRSRRVRPGEVFCDTHGRVRDDQGVCVDCGVPDLTSTAVVA